MEPTAENGRYRGKSGRSRSQRHSIAETASDPGASTGTESGRPRSITASQRLRDTGRQEGDTTPEPASQHLASDRRHRDTGRKRHWWETRQDWETQGDKWGRSQHLASDRRDWETQGDKRETTPEPASQHLASDCRSWETQGDKRETRSRSQHHSIADCETQEDKRPGASVTASGI